MPSDDDSIPDEDDLQVPAPDPELAEKIREDLSAHGRIRAAADMLDDARAALRYGDLNVDDTEVEEMVARIDGQIGELERTLREVSVLTAVWLYARAGIAMALVNALVTPILKLLFFPLILITFGLASGLLNIIALWLLGVLLPNLVIESFLALIYGTLIMALGNVIINWINS